MRVRMFDLPLKAGLAALVLSSGVSGCKERERRERCESARRTAIRTWQDYGQAAEAAVARLDTEASDTAREASATGAQSDARVQQLLARLILVGAPASAPTVATHAPTRVPPTAVDTPPTPLETVRQVARMAVGMAAREAAMFTRHTVAAITSHDAAAARSAANRAADALVRAQAGTTRIGNELRAQAASDAGAADPVRAAMVEIEQIATEMVAQTHQTVQAADRAASAMERAAGALERANLATTAVGAATQNAVIARNAAHAVPEDPDLAGRNQAVEASDRAWTACTAP